MGQCEKKRDPREIKRKRHIPGGLVHGESSLPWGLEERAS
jgi:hypothetical protein